MPDRRFILHAGPPKTGSTTLQLFLKDNVDLMRHQGILWPRTGTELGSHSHRNAVAAFTATTAGAEIRGRLVQELDAAGRPPNVLMSAEMFAHKLGDESYVESLTRFCAGLGYRLHVILYVRPQAPLLNSLYAQHVRNWRPVPAMNMFLDAEVSSGRHHLASCLAPLLSRGAADVTLRPFSASVLRTGLVRDFAEAIGLDLTGAVRDRPDAANVSPGPITVTAFQRLRRRIAQERPDLDRESLGSFTRPIMGAASAQGWNTVKFGGITPREEERITAAFAEENERLSRMAWGKAWSDVFTAEDTRVPPCNVFDPAAATPEIRRNFRAFLDECMEMITAFAGAGDGPGR